MAKSNTKPKNLDDETTSAMVMAMLGEGLDALRQHITLEAKAKLDSEAAADLAHLLTKVAMVAAELRKAEKAARQADGDMSPQQMLERIRRMAAPERLQFLRSAQHADQDQGKSGLA